MTELIQRWLNDIYNLNIEEDGYYGEETRMALIMAYQTELNRQFNKGLEVDGIFGPLTSNAYVTIREGAQGNITRIIQSLLYVKGYDIEDLDGIFGNETELALEDFQRDYGLRPDGIIGKATLDRLFFDYN